MFIPNTFGILSPLTGMTVDGEPMYGTPKRVACAIATLNQKIARTNVRLNASASRGESEETIMLSEIMFPKTVTVDIDHRFIIAGFIMIANNVAPRFDVFGRLDHYEVQFVTLVGQ